MSILNFLAATFALLTLLELPTALTKFASEKFGKNQKEESVATQRKIIKTVMMMSITGFIAAILLSQLISQQIWNNTEYLILLIINFTYAFLHNINKLLNSVFQALYLFGKMATITIIFVILSRAIAIILAFLGFGVTGVLVGYIIGLIIALIVAIKFLHGKIPKTNKTIPLKPILIFSLPLFLTQITALILNWADIVIINTLTGDLSITGVYTITLNSVGALSLLYIPIMTTIFPKLSTHHGLEKTQKMSNILKTSSRIILYLLVPSCIGLAIIAPTALTLFYGSSYAKGAIPLAILSIATIVNALFNLYTTTFGAIGKTGQVLKINIIAAVSTILSLLVLVPIFETTGAALARLFTVILTIALAIYLLKKEIKLQIDQEALWKSIISTLAFVPFLFSIEFFFSANLSTIQMLLIELPLGAAIYVFSLYILKALKQEDFQLLKQALPKPLTKYIKNIERKIVR
ncbi:hypothetical protein AC477_04775 [miscellaneous Crenarchaeota group-1 archaeon SG8-32-1]|uniref:Uncharacterized protein n=1 Tax=miscellaneous Crenarchaeota group-1 archaeon SG8-32-1 TaxID=1685124 RepID=A0A0M0BR09_9ARCH|nr:MAG: hypothetical protein AC477_04775 [miscellaneous Crenarchaeota group-1 archaeon SG8-32-1]